MRFNRQAIRICVGAIALALVFIAIAPSVFRFSANDGVVNGRIIIIRSPISGSIHFAKPTSYGSVFEKGDLIATITNDKESDDAINALKTEERTLTSRVDALAAKLKSFEALKTELAKSLDEYRASLVKKLDADINGIKRKIEQEKAECSRAKSELETNNILNKQMISSRLDNEKFNANFVKSQERINELKWNLESLTTIRAALDKGSYLGDSGHNDAPYSKQRMDQLLVESALTKSVLDEAEGRLASLKSQIAAAERAFEKRRTAKIYATAKEIVWRMPSSEGENIAANNELLIALDCQSVFLDVVASETQFANIKPGDMVRYKLLGSPSYHQGSVVALRGSGSALGDMNLAAELGKNSRKDFRVWVKAAPDDLELCPENFYQIGRRVEAKIPRKWDVKANLLNFINVF